MSRQVLADTLTYFSLIKLWKSVRVAEYPSERGGGIEASLATESVHWASALTIAVKGERRSPSLLDMNLLLMSASNPGFPRDD